MLERMDDALSGGLVQVYDPYIAQDIVPNQHHDLESFLNTVDLVVIMVGHDEIMKNMNKLSDKVIFDTRNVCKLPGVYRM
jgi:UDP-N-acetyl-D-mannosaminuronic acid dehydrogenase